MGGQSVALVELEPPSPTQCALLTQMLEMPFPGGEMSTGLVSPFWLLIRHSTSVFLEWRPWSLGSEISLHCTPSTLLPVVTPAYLDPLEQEGTGLLVGRHKCTNAS